MHRPHSSQSLNVLRSSLLSLCLTTLVFGAMLPVAEAQTRITGGTIDGGTKEMTQIKACREQIAGLKADLKQLELEARELKTRRQELAADRPVRPEERSDRAQKERYARALSEWGGKMAALDARTAEMADRIEAKKRQLEQKEAELRNLEDRAR